MIKKLDDILKEVKGNKKVILSVAAAHDKEVLLAIKEAIQKEIIIPILIGDENKIKEISEEIGFDLDKIKIIQKILLKNVPKLPFNLFHQKRLIL